jgi:hypothetical protein
LEGYAKTLSGSNYIDHFQYAQTSGIGSGEVFTNCYTTADVTASIEGNRFNMPPSFRQIAYPIGYVGYVDPMTSYPAMITDSVITECYRLSTAVVSPGDLSNGTVKTETEMKTRSTYAGWDFKNIWSISSGAYPTLRPIKPTIELLNTPETTIISESSWEYDPLFTKEASVSIEGVSWLSSNDNKISGSAPEPRSGELEVWTLKITAKREGYDTLILSFQLNVLSKPIPSISVVPTGNSTYVFSGFTSNGKGSLHWNLGDGTEAEGVSFKHTYLHSGRYVVTLIARTPYLSTSVHQEMVVFDDNIMGFAVYRTKYSYTLHVNAGTDTPILTGVPWLSVTGQGNGYVTISGIPDLISYVDKTYDVTLSANGTTYRWEMTVLPPSGWPVAWFDIKTNGPDITVISAPENADRTEFSFYDGLLYQEYGTNETFIHTYYESGSYVITQRVHRNIDGQDAVVEFSRSVTVSVPEPIPSISVTRLGGFTYILDGMASGERNSLKWDLGKGIGKTDPVFMYTFPSSGRFTIGLTASNQYHRSATISHDLIVFDDYPVATANFETRYVCTLPMAAGPDRPSLTGAPWLTVTDNGDGYVTVSGIPVFASNPHETYPVKLSANGTVYEWTITAVPPENWPAAGFEIRTNGLEVTVTSTIIGADIITLCFFDGDDERMLRGTLVYTYSTPGTYTLTQYIRADVGGKPIEMRFSRSVTVFEHVTEPESPGPIVEPKPKPPGSGSGGEDNRLVTMGVIAVGLIAAISSVFIWTRFR